MKSLDLLIGIKYFCTRFKGIGGRIRKDIEDFLVEEVLNELKLTKEPSNFLIFRLKKRGIDTLHAVKRISKQFKGKFYFLGMKDAKALTLQYVYTKNKGEVKNIYDDFLSLEFLGYSDKPLTREELKGNNFILKVKDFDKSIVKEALIELNIAIKERKILNFFGYQRFGSKRPVTHLIGKEIIKRNFDEALRILLCYSSPYESKEVKEIRSLCEDKSNYPKVLDKMKFKMDLEKIVIKRFLEGYKPLEILRSLPLKVRRIFTQAYQSYLFNLTLSEAIERGINFFDFQEGDIVLKDKKILRFKKEMEKENLIPLLPLVGYSFRNFNNRFDDLVLKVMKGEGLDYKDFYLEEMPEVSLPGDFRVPIMLVENFNYSLEDDLILSFFLPKGSYATILLRELMKPEDPYLAGF